MNQESMGSRNQVHVGVNRKNKIPQSFLEPIESHKYISLIFESWIPKLISNKFLPEIISSPKVIQKKFE